MSITAKENFRLFYSHQIPEWLPNYRLDRQGINCTFVDYYERPHHEDMSIPFTDGEAQDGFGVWYVFDKINNAPSPNTVRPPIIKDITKWRDYVTMPDVNSVDWRAMAEKDMKGVDRSKFLNMSLGHGLYERLHFMMGMLEANCALLEEPESVESFFTAYIDSKIEMIDKIAEYYEGIDMLEVSDDWGHQNGLFISPAVWDELFKPQMIRLIGHIRAKGFMYLQHCCGKSEALVPHMIDAGIDAWTSCQAINDIENIVHKYGDKIICSGGMDLEIFKTGNVAEAEMKSIIRERIDKLCKGGAMLPYGTFGTPGLAKVVSEVVEEKKYFFDALENRRLP